FIVDPVPLSAVVVVDTGLGAASLSKVQRTFTALAGAFSQFDEVEVYRYDKFVTKVIDFSPNIEEVEVAIKTIDEIKPDSPREANIPSGPFSIPGPVINGAAVVPPAQVGVMTTIPPRASRVLHDAIFAAAADLGRRDRQRRKIVLVVTDGEISGNSHSFDDTV